MKRTHCFKGHEFTVENTLNTKRGQRICKECKRSGERKRAHRYKEYRRQWNKTEINRKSSRKRNIFWKYKVTEEQVQKANEEQKGLCAISGMPPDDGEVLVIDHDHVTGKFRGLLRRDINAALGTFKDNIQLLEMSISYLKRHLGDTNGI